MTGITVDHKRLGGQLPGRETAPRRHSGLPTAAPRRPENHRRLASIGFAADKSYLSLARMTAMHVAGLLGLPLGRVTDLRLAVDEACALFLTAPAPAAPGEGPGQLQLRFDQEGGTLRIRVSGPAPVRPPDADDLGWTMLCALVGEPRWESYDGIGTLTLLEPIPTGR